MIFKYDESFNFKARWTRDFGSRDFGSFYLRHISSHSVQFTKLKLEAFLWLEHSSRVILKSPHILWIRIFMNWTFFMIAQYFSVASFSVSIVMTRYRVAIKHSDTFRLDCHIFSDHKVLDRKLTDENENRLLRGYWHHAEDWQHIEPERRGCVEKWKDFRPATSCRTHIKGANNLCASCFCCSSKISSPRKFVLIIKTLKIKLVWSTLCPGICAVWDRWWSFYISLQRDGPGERRVILYSILIILLLLSSIKCREKQRLIWIHMTRDVSRMGFLGHAILSRSRYGF